MKITLDSGTELTWEEVTEVVEKFKGLFTSESEYFPRYEKYQLPETPSPTDWRFQPYCTCGGPE